MRQMLMFAIVIAVIFGSVGVANDKISEELKQKLAGVQDRGEKIPVVVLYDGLPTFAEVAREYRFLGAEEVVKEQVIRVMKENAESLHFWLRQMCESPVMSGEVEGFTSIWVVNAVALKATPMAIEEIAAQSNVAKIVLDEPVPMLFDDRGIDWGVAKINAPSVWKYYEGQGVVVAVIDTGVNQHGDLKGRVVDGKNYISPGTEPRDDHGHGTHCSGTVAGDGTNGTQTGVAPKATVVAIKVLDSGGSGAWSNLYLAIEEAVANKPKVISMSLGGFPPDDIRNRLRLACQNAIAAGIIPVIAAGNSGASGIGSPGDVPEIITVGATDVSDNIAYFSSRGPTKPWDGVQHVKPDISAPGVNITSCSHTSNGYLGMSGTSMATPHVAGLVALILNAKGGLDIVKVKQILESTATDLGQTGKDNTYGSGRVNADKAVTAAESLVATDERFEMVVKEMTFETTVDDTGNLYISKAIENELLPATVTIWVQARETYARQGVYKVEFTLQGPNGTKTGVVAVDYDNIPTNTNKYDPKYGFNVGNFELVKGTYTGTVKSIEPNLKVKSVSLTIDGKATWPARPAN